MSAELITAARQALEAGRKADAQKALMQVIRSGYRLDVAWYLMSQTVDDPKHKADALQRAKAAGWEDTASAPKVEPVAPIVTPQPTAQQAAPPPPDPPKPVASRLASIPPPVTTTVPQIERPLPTPVVSKRRGVGRAVVGGIVIVLLLAALGGGVWLQRGGSPLAALAVSTPTVVATPTPASCREQSQEWLAASEPLQNQWRDTASLANTTPRVSLAPVLAQLQQIRRDLSETSAPSCAAAVQAALLDGMQAMIKAYQVFQSSAVSIQMQEATDVYVLASYAYIELQTGVNPRNPSNPNPYDAQDACIAAVAERRNGARITVTTVPSGAGTQRKDQGSGSYLISFAAIVEETGKAQITVGAACRVRWTPNGYEIDEMSVTP